MKVFRNTMGKTRNLTAGEASIKISLSKQMGIDIHQKRRLQKKKIKTHEIKAAGLNRVRSARYFCISALDGARSRDTRYIETDLPSINYVGKLF